VSDETREMVMAQRRAEVGVTLEGIVFLRVNAHAYGYAVDEDGNIIDPETNAIVTDRETLDPIINRAERQMETESQTGKKLLEMDL